MSPTFPPSPSPPGCPPPTGPAGSCAIECGWDRPCAPGLLCCSNGCGRSCMPPLPENPCATHDCAEGFVCEEIPVPCFRPPCPVQPQCVPRPSPTPVIEDPCETENKVCPPGQVCRAKTVVCVRAPCNKVAECVPEVQGKCPRMPPPLGLCRADAPDKCRYDHQCGAEELCCINSCGNNECMKPEVLTNPCAATTCAVGQECQVVTPMCVTTPCPPATAVCVNIDPCRTTTCPPGQDCVVATPICKSGPCLPTATCIDLCATVRCNSGSVCVKGKCIEICSLPNDSGPCEAHIPRYYNDPKTGYCKKFFYGGCAGNQNNFHTVEHCTSVCGGKPDPCDRLNCAPDEKCELLHTPCAPGTSPCEPQPVCQKVSDDPCAAVTCLTGTECVNGKCVDVCNLPKQPGPCRAYMPRFYYDSETGYCKRFIYGGCLGNKNNFNVVEDCTRKCGGKPDPCDNTNCARDEKCVLVPTPCAPGSQSCDPVAVCQKDDPCTTVRCRSGTECLDGKCVEICQLPMKHGKCIGNIPRFYFDPTAKTCKRFGYSGCGKNGNNFATKEECGKKCGVNMDPCNGECDKNSKCLTLRGGKNVCVPNGKNGACPNPYTGPSLCDYSECIHDYECQTNQKCCVNDCGSTQCTRPGFNGETPIPLS